MTDNDSMYLPEVATYQRAVDEAEGEFHRRSAELGDMYPLRYPWGTEEERQQSEAHTAQHDEYHERYTRALHAAMRELKKAGDPLVKWIVDHCLEDYPDEALTVLRALPATLSELDKMASEQGWCSAWDGLRVQAVEAGVLSDGRQPAERVLHTWLSRNLSLSRYRRAELNELIDAALDEARTPVAEAA